MLLDPFLTILPLVGQTFITNGGRYFPACRMVQTAISKASRVYYPGSPQYTEGKYHSSASSQQDPACVVEPGTPEDVAKILKVIDSTKTPFAVKSGGHTMNPGFSSTQGIQIYTKKFSQVTYDAATSTAVIGTGLVWDTVYKKLQDHGVIVLGGRFTGVGVGGLLLGGGYSYKTNRYGLCIDTIVGFNLVLPNGTITHVTQSTQPDLFWALKGGFNNFGIVTDFTMTTFPQTEVWVRTTLFTENLHRFAPKGGGVVYPSSSFKQARTAIADFSVHSQDPKAALFISYSSSRGSQSIYQNIFYDGPTPPSGTFDNFAKIPHTSSDLKTRSYLDTLTTIPADLRGSWQMLGVRHFSPTLLEAVEKELTYWTTELTPKGGVSFTYVIEPFLQSHLSHANSPSAWPDPSARQPGKAPNPLIVAFTWNDTRYDDVFIAAIEKSVNRLSTVAKAEGLFSDNPMALYGNFVNANTPLADIYGDNLPKLRALKGKIDPDNVMGLAGGFKF